jgi:hypothetical protein
MRVLRLAAVRVHLVIAAAVVLAASGLVASMPAFASSASPTWSIQPSPVLSGPPQGTLNGVSCTAGTACTAVGDRIDASGVTVTLAQNWNGMAWSMETIPYPEDAVSSRLSDVSCRPSGICMAVGSYVTASGRTLALTEHRGGGAWTIESTPQPAGALDSALTGVSCPNTTSCLAVGSYVDATGTQKLAEYWDGTTWRIEPSPGGGTLYRVTCPSAQFCLAATGGISVEEWNGVGWTTQTAALPASPPNSTMYGYGVFGMSCTSQTTCVAVGAYNLYQCFHTILGRRCQTTAWTLVDDWNGTAWSVVATIQMNVVNTASLATGLSDVSCVASSCMAVGSDNGGPLAEYGNGTAWSVETTPGATTVIGVSCVVAATCEVVGQGNAAPLAEEWNGSALSPQAMPTPVGEASDPLSGVSCPTLAACIAVGSINDKSNKQGTLAEYWDGSTWQQQITKNLPAAIGDALFSVSCPETTTCAAVGLSEENDPGIGEENVALAEGSNDSTWAVEQLAPGYVSVLDSVSCPAAGSCEAVGADNGASLAEGWDGTAWVMQNPVGSGFSGVSCPTVDDCIAVGSLIEQWNGATWSMVSAPGVGPLSSISCPNSTFCVAVGGTQIAEWNGTVWSTQGAPIPTDANTGELSSVSCPTSKWCLAVGSYQTSTGVFDTLAEQWNGNTWNISATANPVGATDSYLSGSSCYTARICTAVGYYVNESGIDIGLVERYQ